MMEKIIKNFQYRRGREPFDTTHKDELLKHICEHLKLKYGDYQYTDWFNNLWEKEDRKSMEKFCFGNIFKCNKCMRENNCIYFLTPAEFQGWNQFESSCRCNACDSEMYEELPNLFILDISCMAMEKTNIPQFIKIKKNRYNLVFVQQATNQAGHHFYYFVKLFDERCFLYNSISNTTNLDDIYLKDVPDIFCYPSIVIFEKGKFKFINSTLCNVYLNHKKKPMKFLQIIQTWK